MAGGAGSCQACTCDKYRDTVQSMTVKDRGTSGQCTSSLYKAEPYEHEVRPWESSRGKHGSNKLANPVPV